MLMRKKTRKAFAFYLGCLYWYIRHLEEPTNFSEAMEFLAEIGVRLGISWDEIEAGCKAWQKRKEERA